MTRFKPDFSKDSSYTPEYNFNRVIWGANAPITEKDINEAQIIQSENIRKVVSTILKNGIAKGVVSDKYGEKVEQQEVVTDEIWYNRYLSDLDGARINRLTMSSQYYSSIIQMIDNNAIEYCHCCIYDNLKRKRGLLISSEFYENSGYDLYDLNVNSIYYFIKTNVNGTNISFERNCSNYCNNLGDYGEGNYLHFQRLEGLEIYPNLKGYFVTHSYYYYNIPSTVVLDGDNKYHNRVNTLGIASDYSLICGNKYYYYSLIDKKELSITTDETHRLALEDGKVICICSKNDDSITIENAYGNRGTGLYICKHNPEPQDKSTYIHVSYFEHTDDYIEKPTGNVYKTEIIEHIVPDTTKKIISIDNAKAVLDGYIIDIEHIDKEILITDNIDVKLFLNLWLETITVDDEVYKYGNLQGETLENYLLDSRYDTEITRREQLVYKLCTESELITDPEKKSAYMEICNLHKNEAGDIILSYLYEKISDINEVLKNVLKLSSTEFQRVEAPIQLPLGTEIFSCEYGQVADGYWHVCDMIMQGDYPDMPIVFSCVQRDALPYQLVLLFKSVRFADGFVPKFFRHISIDGNFNNTINAVIAKVADNKFSLYIKKNSIYDELGIVDMNKSYIHNLIEVKWIGDFVNDYPKDATVQGSWTAVCGNAGYGYDDDTDYLAILVPPHAGDNSHYIKTPYNGIIPDFQKSINDGGHGNIGTLTWAYAMAYIKTICCDLLIPSSDGRGDIGADDKKIGTIYAHVLTGGTILPVQNGTAYVKSLDAYGYGNIGGLNNAYNEASIHRVLANIIGDNTRYVNNIYVKNIHTKSDMSVPSKYNGARKTVFDLTVYFDGTIYNTYSFESDGANKESAFFCYSNSLAVRHSLGVAGAGWDNIYSKSNLIVTSDRRKKKNIFYFGSNENDSVNFWSDELLMNFYMGLKAVVYTYKDGKRPHHGLVSQDFEELMHKLNIQDHAAFIKTPIYAKIKTFVVDGGTYDVTEENDKNTIIDYNYSIRYAELEADTIRFNQLLYKKYEQQQKEIESLKQENNEIKQQLALLIEKVNNLIK